MKIDFEIIRRVAYLLGVAHRLQLLSVLHQRRNVVEIAVISLLEARIDILEPEHEVGHDNNRKHVRDVEKDIVHTGSVERRSVLRLGVQL